MDDKLTISDIAELIGNSLDIDVDFNENSLFIEFENKRYQISNSEINSIINKLDTLSESEFNALYNEKYYEVLVREESPLPRNVFRHSTDYVQAFNDNDNGIYYSFGVPSDVYSIFLLKKWNNVGIDRYFFSLRRASLRLNRRENIRRSESINDDEEIPPVITLLDIIKKSLPRIYSLRINTDKNINIKQFQDYVRSMLFQLSYNMDISFVLINSIDDIARRSRIRRIRTSQIQELDPPRKIYRPDLVYHYQMGVSTDSAPLEFLSYYHIAENFFEEIFEEDLINGLREKLTHPDFSYSRKVDLRNMINYITKRMKIRSETYTFNELEAFKLTLKKFIDLEELIRKLNEIDEKLVEYYKNNEVEFCSAKKVNLESDDVDKTMIDLAKRVYITRNSVVHSKEGTKPKYLPFHHDNQLHLEVPLVRLIAEQIIIKSSKILN